MFTQLKLNHCIDCMILGIFISSKVGNRGDVEVQAQWVCLPFWYQMLFILQGECWYINEICLYISGVHVPSISFYLEQAFGEALGLYFKPFLQIYMQGCSNKDVSFQDFKIPTHGSRFQVSLVPTEQTTRSRTCTLVLLCTALGGMWFLEQPSGSLLEFYPTWRFSLQAICECGGPTAVTSLKLTFGL